jgi:hypothetical protein
LEVSHERGLTALEFISQYRSRRDRGFKWLCLNYHIRAAIESQMSKGKGNAAKRRTAKLKLFAS